MAALEEILVGENVASWSHGSSEAAGGDDGTAPPSIKWDDIDWSAVRRHPRFAAYGGLGGLGAVAGSDLAAYLEALSQAVRELAEPDSPSVGHTPTTAKPEDLDDDEDLDDSGVSSGVEGAEVDDVVDDDVDQAPAKRRQSTSIRNLRLIRNFVRRNLRSA